MKERVILVATFAVLVLMIPMIAINSPPQPLQNAMTAPPASGAGESPLTQQTEQNPANSQTAQTPAPAAVKFEESGFRILDEQTGKVMSVSALEYVRGSVAAEMPPTFHAEALRAQAVASHTYAVYLRTQSRQNGQDYDFSADPANWKVFTTEKQFYERYGEYADAYWQTLCDAVDPVAHYVLLYENEPIVAAYHSMSGGVTEDAGNVWQGSVDYLVPATSFGDTLAPDYEKEQMFSVDDVRTALAAVYPDMDFSAPPGAWFVIEESNPGGYVANITVCGQTLRGVDVRACLGLRSAAFTVDYMNGGFIFTVNGYGHGVGLSQYGADYLGRQGETFDEILLHYYTGVTLAAMAESGG